MNTTVSGVRPRNRGFTLVELLMVLAVLGAMMAFAVPNFREYQRNAALTNAANTLVSAVYRVRSEAMKEGTNAILMPSNDDGTGTGTDWNKGWVIFIDRDLSNDYDQAKDGDPVFVQPRDEIPDYINVENSGTDGFVKFNGAGFPRDANNGFGGLTLTVTRSDRDGDRYTRRIIISGSGRVKSCRPDVDGTANCPAPAPASGGGGGSGGGGSGGGGSGG